MFSILFLLLYIFILIGTPFVVIYFEEKRSALNSENKNFGYFIRKFFWINFTFNGRINRYEFLIYGGWIFWLAIFLIFSFSGYLFANLINLPDNEIVIIPFALLGLAFIVHQYAVYIKRLHDLNKSGWNVLWSFIPLLGFLYLFIICWYFKGTEGTNDYGPDPNTQIQSTIFKPLIIKLIIWISIIFILSPFFMFIFLQ